MIRLLPLSLLLAGCVQTTARGFEPAQREVALQRMRFVVEAVCLNNRTRAAQDRAARRLGFPLREVREGTVFYANPATLTFLQLGQSPELGFTQPDGTPRSVRGPACGVGSPAVGVANANRLLGEVLAPRLVEGDRTVSAPVALGENEDRGFGFLFEGLVVTVLRLGEVTFSDPEAAESVTFRYPVILVVHDR